MLMTRFAPPFHRKFNTVKRALACGLAGLVFVCPVTAESPAANQSLVVDLGQAPGVAQAALQAGNPGLALRLSEGMLKADPDNGQAHYLKALAQAALNDGRG